jgi:PncC family amidohydrolase
MLGIDRTEIERYGVVSGETARMMAEAALEKSGADISVSVTGLAGPDGDGRGTPVGTVWMAAAARETGGGRCVRVERFRYEGDRATSRETAALDALRLIRETPYAVENGAGASFGDGAAGNAGCRHGCASSS